MTPPEQSKSVPRPAYITLLRDSLSLRMAIGTTAVIVIGLGVIALTYLDWFSPPDDSWLTFGIRELGGGLLVVAIANVVIQMFIERYRQQLASGLDSFLREDVTAELRDIRADIKVQTHALVDGSANLAALSATGVSHAYPSRGAAAEHLRGDIEAPGIRHIRVMGISLNDFLRRDQHPTLRDVWKVITSYLDGERRLDRDLEVRVLIIDPLCQGAMLRSYGESAEPDHLSGRLEKDVMLSAKRLAGLVDAVASAAPSQGRGRVTFEFRVYRLPPTMFLCATDRVSYVQPYYFWSSYQSAVTMPVLRLEGSRLHDAMVGHFDLVWDRASINGPDWLASHQIGLDKGAHESGVVNIFTDPRTSSDRMRWLIENAGHRVWIQGISLKSFFDPGWLQAALHGAVLRDGVDVRILLLDPESDAARHRSFREHEFSDHCSHRFASFDDYAAHPACHAESPLARDTWTSIKKLVHSRIDWQDHARLYDMAPTCFVLMVDDEALVEQYHFGKAIPPEFRVGQGGTPPILGKEMGHVEYTREPMHLVAWDHSRHPYDLLESHLEFVWERGSKPLPGEDPG